MERQFLSAALGQDEGLWAVRMWELRETAGQGTVCGLWCSACDPWALDRGLSLAPGASCTFLPQACHLCPRSLSTACPGWGLALSLLGGTAGRGARVRLLKHSPLSQL